MRSDPETTKKPSLRISHIVYGRESCGSRVVYLLDPAGKGDEKAIAEQVVLHRWRRRVFPGYVFSGARLSPNIWRALPTALGKDATRWCGLQDAEISELIDRTRDFLRAKHFALPGANVIRALLQVCGPERLSALVSRHNDPVRADNFGTPDLFLFATCASSGAPGIARFVEVKKPEEAVSPDQHDEIAFMQGLGLHARILRLVESSA